MTLVAASIFEMTVKMFLRDNFIHGDLHAGNLLYDPVSKKVTVRSCGARALRGAVVGFILALGVLS
jgi:predicted unusual protein kinase regulating ubiquinone biosynthesis (AarF/ABC1/UbiB family)